MEKMLRVTEPCPLHQAVNIARPSEAVRFLAVLQLAALRAARNVINRRIARMEESDKGPREKAITITVTGEPPRDG